MQRVLEPELMLDHAQVRAYVQADLEAAHSQFVVLFQDIFGPPAPGSYVLDLGCGPGDITFRFARAYPMCTIHGVDGSESMLNVGRRILAETDGMGDRVELIHGRLPFAALPRAKYDIIISNSDLHHFHDPHVFWEAVRQYADAGARVLVMDLMRPKTTDQAWSFVETYSANEPDIFKRDFYNSLLAAFEVEEIRGQLEATGLGHLSINVISDRHLIIEGYSNTFAN
jgi:ubiquinone/menaquinone biosynthesis C-methylase UbiE